MPMDDAREPVGARAAREAGHKTSRITQGPTAADDLGAITRIHSLAGRLMTIPDLSTALGEVLDAAIALFNADRGTLQIHDPEDDVLRYAALRGFDTSALDKVPPIDRDFHSTCAIALRTEQRVVASDLYTDPHWADHASTAEALGYRAAISTPLKTRREEFQGVLTVHFDRAYRPSDEELRWADLLARLAAHVIERAHSEQALRDSERHAQVLLAELQHRVRNTLAVMRSIARRTADNSASVREMADHFQGRLDAFARVQAALTRSTDSTVDLVSLVEEELLAHAAHDGRQVQIGGPEIALEQKTAERISLAIHELTTNAVKHGALTNGTGQIRVSWEIGGDRLLLRWEESGVKLRSRTIKREGFGMELLRRSLPYDLNAQTTVELRPSGLFFELDMPLKGDHDARQMTS